ncbi:hypothetical protein [Frateuria terrea]|jgi:hypothetical protein|uniref:Uncharacterized protein n=1 Tax=Frateuria terrea TaxID=529704 RepID=A0A1H6VT18_9GAMM|nr:hypothetical protein [Frateuria terrea]SEJ03760.1 hypothetical protein SAMN04487997_2285 [Frateuria terrea]SFP63747.1 hypothetical protein SAMN02927913_2945 [Frateuria terrea]
MSNANSPVTDEALAQLIALANDAMRAPIPGVSLRMFSPNDLDAEPDERAPLPPGVRRIALAIDKPEVYRGPESPGTVRLVFFLYVAGHGPTVQLDSEALLRWAAQVEAAASPAHDAASDLANPATVRTLAKDRVDAREVSQALAGASRAINSVADEVRAAVADPATWLPISPADAVIATVSVHRISQEGRA